MQTIYKENRTIVKEMQKVKKKPLVVKALQMDDSFKVETPEGWMTARKGDWLVRGIEGEFYAVKKRIFKKTYDIVD